MKSRTLMVSGAALPWDDVVAVRLRGDDGVDGLFEYGVTVKVPEDEGCVVCGGSDDDLDACVGKEAHVEIELADGGGGKREINGLVTEARFLREEGRHVFYELTMRPWLYLATLRKDVRIFQDRTVVEIVEAVLGDYGYPCDWRLMGSYPKRDYQTQYNETDYDFFVRLCEEWGISYFFEHEGGAHRLVLVDEMAGWRQNPNERYRQVRFHVPDEAVEEEYIDALSPVKRLVSGRYGTREYDYTRPKADLTVGSANPRETGWRDAEVFEWHEGTSGGSDYAQPKAGPGQAANDVMEEGGRLARLRMQALRSRGWRARGGGNLRGLTPGCRFELVEHPSRAANVEYLTLRATLLVEEVAGETQKAGAGRGRSNSAAVVKEGLREQEWRVRVDFELHPTREVYRVEAERRKPVVAGPEVALVVGPEGENIWTDELGRIKVKFYWDRYGKQDENASCWLRVSSPWAGNQLGSMQLPRVGQEVIVSYLGGDPDLPLVTGRVHNQENLPPWQLPGQQALSGFRSRELVEGGGGNGASGRSNALVLDDTEGRIQAKLRSDHLGSELSLGYVTRVEDHAGRKEGRGEGFELRTDGHGVVRSAGGLYMTTELRLNGEGPMKGMEETVERLEQARGQQETLAEVAETFGAEFAEQGQVAKRLEAGNGEIRGQGETDEGSGRFPELEAAHLVLSSARDVQSASEGATHIAAGESLALTSGTHLSVSVGRRLLASVTEGIRYFVRQAGMKFIAAAGDIDVKALKDNLNLMGKVEIRQSANRIVVKAKEEILLVGGGSYIRINGSTIESGTAGDWVARAGRHQFKPPATLGAGLPGLPKLPEGQLKLEDVYANAQGLRGAPYRIVDVLGKAVEGTLDGGGRSFASGLAAGPARVFFQKEPRKPTDDGSDFNQWKGWPGRLLNEMAGLGRLDATRAPLSGILPIQARSLLEETMQMAEELGGALRGISALPGAAMTTATPGFGGGLAGMSSIPGWGGDIPLSRNFSGGAFDPLGKLGDLADGGVSSLADALPKWMKQSVAEARGLADTVSQLSSRAQGQPGALARVAQSALPGGFPGGAGGLPRLSTPPFV